ncbi:MAG: alcohol dehydrogenase catalytic domain-containing protein [Nitrososphaeraceae archaeon]|nr:alcohol dehydrogenase catalytic domain-containing protein [Nitrososphaeraceae archaeon]MDW0145225.1 alcohol dehydrogenase catalytic domain-containing protein [Nitrososphaeraceae archaeon]MDW0158019.1 alcohol dehydrogenase catalytic domain-containing protein [Nitrososphaeraceae archaeon]
MLTVKVVDKKVTLVESELPKVNEDEMLVRMQSCGICGSDLEKVYGNYGMRSLRVGHEPAGVVIKVGKNLKKFQVGDRVFVHHHVSCYSCRYCLQGNYTMCNNYQTSNIEPCGLSEEFIVPKWNIQHGGVLKLPESISYDEAALIEPFACCIRGLNKISIKHGDNVAILGAGPTGVMHTLLARLWGANNIVVSDVNEFRLKFVEKYGVTAVNLNLEKLDDVINNNTESLGVDVTILATGSMKAFESSLRITRRGGKILLFGVPSVGSKCDLDLNSLYSNEQIIIPSYGASEIETNQALSLMSDKSIDLLPLVTHRFQLRESDNAFKCAHEAVDAMKVLVVTS